MKTFIDFTTTKPLNGIIRYLYDNNNHNIWDSIIAEVSSNDSSLSYLMPYAFDFDDATYWVGDHRLGDPVHVIFCFKNFYVKPSGFELSVPGNYLLAKSFSFSSLNNKKEEVTSELYSYSFEPNAVHYFSFHSSPSQCFKLVCHENVYDASKRFDVNQIEIYGEIHKSFAQFCQPRQTKFINIQCVKNALFTIFCLSR